MAEIVHKDTPPDEYELTEVDGKHVAGCPYCSYLTEPEDTKEQARVRVAMHLLDEQKKESGR